VIRVCTSNHGQSGGTRQVRRSLLGFCLVVAGISHAQVAGFPNDAHLASPESYSATEQQMLDELASAQRMLGEHPSAQANLSVGKALRVLGENEPALKFFDRALELDPRTAEAWFEKGLITSDHGDWSKAADLFRHAVSDSPNFVPAHLALGEMLLRVGEFDGATTELKTALRLDPRSLGGHEGLGLIYLQQGKLDDGAEEFRRALAIKPGYPVAEKDLARTLARQHQWAEAVRLLRQILVVNPNSIEESSSLATALANLGDKAGAAAQFARARQLSNQELLLLRAQGDRNWGVSLRKEGRLQDAAAAFRRAIQDDASYGEAHDDLGEVLWMQNDLSGALSEFEIAVRCNPGSGLARNNLGSALLYYQHDIDRAIEELRSAVTSRPGFALAHLNLGKALAAKQDFAAAEMELRSAIAITPDFAAAHLNLGLVIAARKGSLSTEAQVEMEKGLRLDPRLREMIPQQYLLYVR
jgi:protein O-GlcNAc transferase